MIKWVIFNFLWLLNHFYNIWSILLQWFLILLLLFIGKINLWSVYFKLLQHPFKLLFIIRLMSETNHVLIKDSAILFDPLIRISVWVNWNKHSFKIKELILLSSLYCSNCLWHFLKRDRAHIWAHCESKVNQIVFSL